MSRLSVIVVGGGHNGLVAATYLAQGGANVQLLERRDFVGGACVTEELFPGYQVSSCSYASHLLQEKVIEDLNLVEHGLDIISLDPFRIHIFPEGQSLCAWQDHESNVEQIRRLSTRDAARYTEFSLFWKRASGLLHPYFLTEPPTLAEITRSVQGTEDEMVWESMLTGNIKDLVEQYFESPIVRTAFTDAHDAGDVRAPGSIMAAAYFYCFQFTNPKYVGIPRGGMGNITQAMARAASAAGVKIRTGVEIDRISVKSGKADGVLLSSGERIDADVVLSNADPKRTFLKLLDAQALGGPFIESIRRLKTEVSCLKLHCALDRLPDFSTFFGIDFDPKQITHLKICPSVSYLEQSWQDARSGCVPSCPVMTLQIPTIHDKRLAPPGKHIMSAWVRYAPVHLSQETWDDVRQRVGESLIDTIAQYAPNIQDAITDWQLFTPMDLERRMYLTDGNIRHLDVAVGQMLAQRPNRQLSGYKTPVAGLYLCGAGTHPGGEVTGAPGHNAARVVLEEYG